MIIKESVLEIFFFLTASIGFGANEKNKICAKLIARALSARNEKKTRLLARKIIKLMSRDYSCYLC